MLETKPVSAAYKTSSLLCYITQPPLLRGHMSPSLAGIFVCTHSGWTRVSSSLPASSLGALPCLLPTGSVPGNGPCRC